ncbi:MAG: hypothetical protein JWO54_624 [Candidatus Saccharibacteria bacterium]|nr:hypothetical protein [Candidatus Saccharibacteria bacterium]
MRKVVPAFIVAVALAVGLTGCTSGWFSETVEPESNYPTVEPSMEAVYVNPNTGLITKYIGYEGEVLFNQGYSKVNLKSRIFGNEISPASSMAIYETVEVEGKSYPVVSTLQWDNLPTATELVTYYNEHIAKSTPNLPDILKGYSVCGMVTRYIHGEVTSAISSGTLPKIQYSLTEQSSVKSDARVAQLQADSVPAWAAYKELNGSVDPGRQYHYSYYCGMYSVQSNADEMLAALNARFAGSGTHFTVDFTDDACRDRATLRGSR